MGKTKRSISDAAATKKETPMVLDAATIEKNITAIESAAKQVSGERSMLTYTTLADTISETSLYMADIATKSTAIKDKTYIADHYGNSLSAIGNEDRVQSFSNYGFSADTLNWPLWLALYNDSWVFRRAIDKPAQDEIVCGFTLHGIHDYSKVYKLYERYSNDMIELLSWGALFGGSIAVMLFRGITDEELKKPLNKKKIKGKRFRLYVVDRWYGVAPSDKLVSDMRDVDYGKPMYYDVTMANGVTKKIHHSWILRYEHRTAPRLIKNGQLQGWGYSEGSHIINELARDDQLKTSITSLVNKSLIEVIKMAGMRGVFMGTDSGNETQLRKRLEMVNWGRTYNSLTFLDKDDEYQHFELTGLAGLADLMEKNMWLISSALEMQGILFGDLKGGLSQESDAFKRYAKTILRRCNAYVRPVLYKFLLIIFIVLGIDEYPSFDFNRLDQDEENKRKIEDMTSMANVLSKVQDNGIISKYQYAIAFKEFVNNDAINIDFSAETLNKLKLEEEQAILDTIKEIGTKRNMTPRTTANGSIDLNNPFGRGSTSEPAPISHEEHSDITEEHEEKVEETSQPDEGENTNGNNESENGSQGSESQE